MSDEFRASIVIPTFNRAGMVRRAIDSALDQTVACEVIVSDHGSTDETQSLVSQYGERIRYLRRDVDNGPFFSWLDGVINARGEYVHINHDDDWVDKEFIEKTVNLFRPDCSCVFTAAAVHQGDSIVRTLYGEFAETGIHPRRQLEYLLLNSEFTVSPGCALFRRRDVLRAIMMEAPVGTIWYKGAGSDMLMFLLPLLEYPRFGFINENLAHFRDHSGSITMDAMADDGKRRLLVDTYNDAKRYYLLLRDDRRSNRRDRLLRRERRKERVRTMYSAATALLGRLRQRVSRRLTREG